jgi:kynurenine formamidase
MTDEVINNWARWGENDQLGTLNLMTAERILAALRLVKRGQLYSLSVPLEKDGPQHPMFHKTWQVTFLTSDHAPGAFNVADDVVTMVTHSGTHIDALGHCWKDGKMWNGKSADHVGSHGITWGAIHNVPGIVGRGVLLDVAGFKGVEHLTLGEVVTPEDMDACARAEHVEIGAGDVLLIRTGWYTVFQKDRTLWEQGEPGPDAAGTAWFKAKDVIAIGADNAAVEAYVARTRSPLTPRLHITAIRDLGVYLMENMNLEELARDRTYEFLFVAAPLNLTNATGAPFAPLAIA